MEDSLAEIRRELLSITKSLKLKVEYEQIFGIDTLKFNNTSTFKEQQPEEPLTGKASLAEKPAPQTPNQPTLSIPEEPSPLKEQLPEDTSTAKEQLSEETLTAKEPLPEEPSTTKEPLPEKLSPTKEPPLLISDQPSVPKESTVSVTTKPETEEDKNLILAKVRDQALKCKQCYLYKTRKNLVFGTGNANASLMFVGEAPGYYEDKKGEPFVGNAGELLTKIIKAIGMERKDVYIANILKCRPPKNRNPNGTEILVCSPFLREQIDIIKPKIICALGTFAAQTLLETKTPIGMLRGKFHDYNGIKMMPTYHPSYLLRTPGDKRKTWEDMKKIRDYLKNE